MFINKHRFSPSEGTLWRLTLVLIVAIAAVVAGNAYVPRSGIEPSSLVMRATDFDGRMRVEWDPKLADVRKARGATLEVVDGPGTNRYPVEAAVVRGGTLDYLRQSDDVLLTLTVHREGRAGLQGILRSVGKAQRTPPAIGQVAKVEPPVKARRPAQRARRARSGSRR